jgi:hypothetical protein
MQTPQHFSDSLSLSEQILYALATLKEATADTIVTELMELRGIATEDGLEDLTIEINKELEKLFEAGRIRKEGSQNESVYAFLAQPN